MRESLPVRKPFSLSMLPGTALQIFLVQHIPMSRDTQYQGYAPVWQALQTGFGRISPTCF